MINNWMVPKNKRRLTSVVDSLMIFSIVTADKEWSGDVENQRQFESLLEKQNLKRVGDRRDKRAGGARTYEAQLAALGLIFEQDSSHSMRLTLAGEALVNGESPALILRRQLLKFQYPSAYSLRQNVAISPKYRIKPFLFILRLLNDEEIKTLSQAEIARFVITFAHTDADYQKVKNLILNYRIIRDDSWITNEHTFLNDTGGTRTKDHTLKERIDYLDDIANIFINYMESVQLVERIREESKIKINPEMKDEINIYLSDKKELLLRDVESSEIYQRRYGLDLVKSKDNRSFGGTNISNQELEKRLVMRKYLDFISKHPVITVSDNFVKDISDKTGVSKEVVKSILQQKLPNALDTFEAGYWDMAHQGTEHAIDFELSTKDIFQNVLNFYAEHIGQVRPLNRRGGNPDVFIVSLSDKYSGIIDTKAYFAYGLDNDHRIRMKTDYIPDFRTKNVNGESINLAFYLYVAGGFDNTFDSKLEELSEETNLKGSAINAINMIRLIKRHVSKPFSHSDLLNLFTINRQILPADFDY